MRVRRRGAPAGCCNWLAHARGGGDSGPEAHRWLVPAKGEGESPVAGERWTAGVCCGGLGREEAGGGGKQPTPRVLPAPSGGGGVRPLGGLRCTPAGAGRSRHGCTHCRSSDSHNPLDVSFSLFFSFCSNPDHVTVPARLFFPFVRPQRLPWPVLLPTDAGRRMGRVGDVPRAAGRPSRAAAGGGGGGRWDAGGGEGRAGTAAAPARLPGGVCGSTCVCHPAALVQVVASIGGFLGWLPPPHGSRQRRVPPRRCVAETSRSASRGCFYRSRCSCTCRSPPTEGQQ